LKVHLGNITGFCPFPDSCVELAVNNFNYILRGQQDDASVDIEYALGFPPLEKLAAEWNNQKINPDSREIIPNLATAYATPHALFANGSPSGHNRTVKTIHDAEMAFGNPMSPFEVAFVGQTGSPASWVKNIQGEVAYIRPRYANIGNEGKYTIVVPENSKVIFNVGSVGFPKDNDARASYVVYDTETQEATYFRVPYSIDKTVGRMQQQGFSTKACMKIMHGS
jgi:diadenosine tetraphosphatase ApaH/serine/threonine PP2A family protein phosphatase